MDKNNKISVSALSELNDKLYNIKEPKKLSVIIKVDESTNDSLLFLLKNILKSINYTLERVQLIKCNDISDLEIHYKNIKQDKNTNFYLIFFTDKSLLSAHDLGKLKEYPGGIIAPSLEELNSDSSLKKLLWGILKKVEF